MAVLGDVACMLECVQCVSDESGYCANNPPPAKPCQSNEQAGGPVNCMVAKKKNASGYVVQFIRGCTGVWISSGCMEQTDDTTLCYRICSTNNCNTASRNQTAGILLFLIQLLYLILY